MEAQDILPASASADGRRNIHFHRCQVVGHCRPYAACLSIVDARAAGPLSSNYASCSEAIGRKSCPAMHMRDEEALAGKAIYFRPNDHQSDVTPAPSGLRVTAPGRHALRKGRKKQSALTDLDAGSYADALNNFNDAAPHVRPTAAAPTPIPSTLPAAGESPLDLARRLMAAQQTTGA